MSFVLILPLLVDQRLHLPMRLNLIAKVLCVSSLGASNCCYTPHSITVISSATENFSKDRVIGCGGFGIVYKGLINGSYVAIKKLNEVSCF